MRRQNIDPLFTIRTPNWFYDDVGGYLDFESYCADQQQRYEDMAELAQAVLNGVKADLDFLLSVLPNAAPKKKQEVESLIEEDRQLIDWLGTQISKLFDEALFWEKAKSLPEEPNGGGYYI